MNGAVIKLMSNLGVTYEIAGFYNKKVRDALQAGKPIERSFVGNRKWRNVIRGLLLVTVR